MAGLVSPVEERDGGVAVAASVLGAPCPPFAVRSENAGRCDARRLALDPRAKLDRCARRVASVCGDRPTPAVTEGARVRIEARPCRARGQAASRRSGCRGVLPSWVRLAGRRRAGRRGSATSRPAGCWWLLLWGEANPGDYELSRAAGKFAHISYPAQMSESGICRGVRICRADTLPTTATPAFPWTHFGRALCENGSICGELQ